VKPTADATLADKKRHRLFENQGPALVDFIDMKHPLVCMADQMQWEVFESHWQT